MEDLRMDESLAAEAEALAGNDIHDVRATIANYVCYARWLTRPPVRRSTGEALLPHGAIRANFMWSERILRAFVAARRNGDLRGIRRISEELLGGVK